MELFFFYKKWVTSPLVKPQELTREISVKGYCDLGEKGFQLFQLLLFCICIYLGFELLANLFLGGCHPHNFLQILYLRFVINMTLGLCGRAQANKRIIIEHLYSSNFPLRIYHVMPSIFFIYLTRKQLLIGGII